MASSQRAWHAMSSAEVIAECNTSSEAGLTTREADARRQSVGVNALPTETPPNPLRQLLAQFVNPLVGTLLAAAVVGVIVAVVEKDPSRQGLARFSDALAILLIVVVNAIIGFTQERRAEKALDALKAMSAPRCKVVRDGSVATVDSIDLVPGDLVLLAEGDQIPADLRLIESSSLESIEGALTGESTSVSKDARRVLPADTGDGDKLNMAFMGTTIVRGAARGVVVSTGPLTRLGQIGSLLAGSEKPKSPLEERLEDFGTKILWLCVAISGALFVIGLVQGGRWHQLLLTAVSVAVAAIPEGLPAITTITLALGMTRMAKHHAIVRKLPAVETLGCVGVICTDKTGTLTRNEMTVRTVWTARTTYEATGEGYGGPGELRAGGVAVAPLPPALETLLRIGAAANTSSLERVGEQLRVAGDPTEGALLALAVRGGVPRDEATLRRDTVHVVPFDSDRKRMSVVLKAPGEGRVRVYTKGAVERVLACCTHWLGPEGVEVLDEAVRAEVMKQVEALSARALRVLAFAEREGPGSLAGTDHETDAERAASIEQSLCFVGLTGMLDPPRLEVKPAIEECRLAGIRAVMITGDHPLTAEAIAKELGLWEAGDVTVTGDELEKTSDEALQVLVRKARVFARVSPEHKLRIVRAFRGARPPAVVAMTGDGVNDAPAIRESSIGIAMGLSGTDVARQAADMILADDNFATIVEAVREGRAIFSNIKKSIFFLLSSNAGLCLTVFVTSFFKDMPALTPIQILWINLVTNGLPALALGVDPPEENQMRQSPREPGEPFLKVRDWVAIVAVGAVMAVCSVVLYRLPIWEGQSSLEAERSKLTLVFSQLALSPLFHAFNCRSERASVFKLGWLSNRWLVGAVIVSAAVHLVSLLVPPLRPVFKTDHVWVAAEVWWVLGLSFLPVPVVELVKLLLPSPAPRRAT